MSAYNVLIINVDELWLKGKNRPQYFKAIKHHIKEVIGAYHSEDFQCANENQRMVAHSEVGFSEDLIQALCKVPGVHSISPARKIALDFDKILPEVISEIETLPSKPKTFKVETKRANKRFSMGSMEISRQLGHLILRNFSDLKVDVHNPELIVRVRILDKNIYVSTRDILGLGGLPFNTSGHLITMLSGGFDSPVASYLMSKRGCRQTFVFFYAYPFVGDEVKEKIFELVKVLGKFQRYSTLYIVPFGDFQSHISKECREDYRTVLFRKYMIECSNLIADRINADALLTGDALGQVSSQTIGNMSLLDRVSLRPIFRPLVGYNKIEIVNLSKEIGTHDISVIPHDDACSLFAPKHPIIKPDWTYFERFIQKFDSVPMLNECIDAAEKYSISLKGELLKLN